MIRVKEILKSKGMTAKELAGKIGITEGALSQTLKEGANPSLKTLTAIATALNVEVAELFTTPVEGSITCPYCGKPIALHPTTTQQLPPKQNKYETELN